MDIKKFLLSILISISIFFFCFSSIFISAETELTAEQEFLTYATNTTLNWSQGIPYLPSWFSDKQGWTSAKVNWDKFVSDNTRANRIFLTTVSDTDISLTIINYTSFATLSYQNRSPYCIIYSFDDGCSCTLTAKFDSTNNYWTVSCSYSSTLSTRYLYENTNNNMYIQLTSNGVAVLFDDDKLLYESVDDKKSTGVFTGLKNLLTGKFSLINNDLSLVDNLSLFGDSFNNWFNDLVDINIDASSDEYTTLLNDLEYNTQNSAYITNVSQDTLTQIRNTYSNLKQCFDNSISVYNDDNDNYYYNPKTTYTTYSTTNNTSTPNYIDYVTNQDGDTTQYFNTYIADNTSTSGDDSGSSGSSNGSNGSGCNCNNSANATIGDIIINNNIPVSSSGSGSSSGTEDVDIDTSSFKKMIDDNKNFLELVASFVNAWDTDIKISIASLFIVVVMCRIFGR